MSLAGFIDTGGGSDWAGNTLHITGTDGQHYVNKCTNSVISLGSVSAWCFETGLAAFSISSAQFTTDLAGFGVTDPFDFEIQTVIDCKGTAHLWVLGVNKDGDVSKTQFPVVGIRYRIDDPSTYVADGYMHRKASAIQTAPSDLRNYFGATVIAGYLYAVIAAGATYAVGDDVNARIVYGLPMTGNDVDLTNSSWDAICGHLDCFAEAGVLGGLSTGADLDALLEAKVSVVKASSGIGVMFRRSNSEMPFTVVASNLMNTGETDIASSFGGLPISGDEGLDYNGSPDSNVVSYYRSPNVEYNGATQELLFSRCFKDGSFPSNGPGVNYMRIRRYTFSPTDNSIAFVDTNDFLFNVAGMIFDERYAFTCREGDDINVAGAVGRYLQAGYITLPAPETGESEPATGDDTPVSYTPRTYITKVRQLKPYPRLPINEYRVGSGAKSKFPVSFRVMSQTDLRVTVDAVELSQSEFTFNGIVRPFPGYDDEAALADDPTYYIENHNGFPGYDGGSLVLDAAVTDSLVVIWSDPVPVRTTDFGAA